MLFLKTLALFLSFTFVNAEKIRCLSPAQASFSGDKCWMLVSIPMNFIEAAKYCQSFDGSLTSIHNAFDNIYLADLTHFFSQDFYYIGATNLDDRKTWAWMDGSVMDFTDWGNYEPIDGILNNCMVVSVGHGIWHTHDCTTSSPFVCQVPEDHSLPTTPHPPPTTTTWNPIQNVSTVIFSTITTPDWNKTTTTMSNNGTSSAPMTTPAVIPSTNSTPGVVSMNPTATVSVNSTPIVTDKITPPTAPTPAANATPPPSLTPPAANTNSHSENDPSSTPKRFPRESSTPYVGSGANSNRLFNSLLTSIAVGKAAEYLPKFDNVQKRNNPKSHFKSYRQH
uniref:C-type lectin domain-containing protein n=1 Tax=Panagrolaimus davidi TaxID=227884 RepID=A0A914PPF2_9BILA